MILSCRLLGSEDSDHKKSNLGDPLSSSSDDNNSDEESQAWTHTIKVCDEKRNTYYKKQDKARRKMTGSLDPIDPNPPYSPKQPSLENAPLTPVYPLIINIAEAREKHSSRPLPPHIAPTSPPSFDFFSYCVS